MNPAEKEEYEAYAYADRHFREDCRLILGAELGPLADYEEWLSGLKQPSGSAKSFISGKGISLVSTDYSPSAKFVTMEEASKVAAAPLPADEIKDIDSLFSAVAERAIYSGNLVFGNSHFVAESSDVSDSYYIYKSARVSGCKSVTCSTIAKDSSYLFGCSVASKDEHCMRCHQFTFDARCFESNIFTSCSDCYYVYDCVGCRDAMFSFGQRNASHCIGNRALPKDKYFLLKASLLEQMRSELVSKKKLKSFQDIFREAASVPAALPPGARKLARPFERKSNRAPVQKAWDDSCRLVLGKEQGGISGFREWLLRHNIRVRMVDSVLGSGKIPAASYENLRDLPDSRYVNIDERFPLMKLLKLEESEALSLTLANAGKTLSKIAYITPQFHEGTNLNAYACPLVLWSADCEEVHGCVFMKKSAFSTWARDSEHMFGCAFVFDSSFCIKCYSSFKLKGCFEVDSSRHCTSSYFLHNCENVHDSMFCFNTKNKRYAIGNVEVGREKFLAARKILLDWVNLRLEKEGKLDTDIYRIAGYGKEKGKK